MTGDWGSRRQLVEPGLLGRWPLKWYVKGKGKGKGSV